MTTARYPTPQQVRDLLEQTSEPAKPQANVVTLEALQAAWPYPKGLQLWEGYIYADLMHQLGWARYLAGDDQKALQAWRECPWPACLRGERLALGNLLQRAQAMQSLVLSPQASELLSQEQIGISELLAALDDETTALAASPSGTAYILEANLMRTDGLYQLRLEFDGRTLFFISFLPKDVATRLSTARAFFQMGSASEAASWMLRGAHAAAGNGLETYARSFLDKAAQLDPGNAAVKTSRENLIARGVEPTFSSRVVAERALLSPDPLSRTAVRPSSAPEPEGPSLEQLRGRDGWRQQARAQGFQEWEKVSPPLAMIQPQGMSSVDALATWDWWRGKGGGEVLPILVPGEWIERLSPELGNFQERHSRTRALGTEEVGQWRDDHRKASRALAQSWPEQVPERLAELPLPESCSLALFGLSHLWQVPLALSTVLGGPDAVVRLAAWLRRLSQRWGASPAALSEDLLWLYLPQPPQRPDLRTRFLGELVNMSKEFEEMFEPETWSAHQGGLLIPVPYTP